MIKEDRFTTAIGSDKQLAKYC